jgi:hypothetical protein
MAAATNCGFEIVPYSPYSPVLAPSDFYLFSKLKTMLRGSCFGSNEADMEDQNREFYFEGLTSMTSWSTGVQSAKSMTICWVL